MRPVNQIEISGFKSIRDTKLDLKPLNVLIGPNGAGKSNFIGIFKLLHRIVEHKLGVYVGEQGGANSMLHFGRKRTPSLKLNIEFAGSRMAYGCVLTPNAQDRLFFEDEWCEFAHRLDGATVKASLTRQRVQLDRGENETGLLTAEEYPVEVASYVRYFQDWRLYHFHDTSSSAGVKQTWDVADNRVLREDASNLAAFLFRLKQTRPQDYSNIIGAVRMVAPFFDDFALVPTAENAVKIRLEWKEKGSDGYFDASALSDGTLRFICLTTLLLQPSLPSVVLIDEPELGLHPTAITLLAELLRSASQRTQVIVSTQSVTLINQLVPEEIIVVEHNDGASSFKRLADEQLKDWIGDYGLGELWEKNLVGGRP